jgi:hypothetical protein
LCLDPSVAIAVLNNLVWNLLDIALHFGVRELPSDETLRGEKSVLRVHNGLTLSRNTDQTLAILGEANHRRCRPRTCISINQPKCSDA